MGVIHKKILHTEFLSLSEVAQVGGAIGMLREAARRVFPRILSEASSSLSVDWIMFQRRIDPDFVLEEPRSIRIKNSMPKGWFNDNEGVIISSYGYPRRGDGDFRRVSVFIPEKAEINEPR